MSHSPSQIDFGSARPRAAARFRVAAALLVAALVSAAALLPSASAATGAQGAATKARRIAVFGSSVAYGTGDERGQEGYTGRLRTLLAAKGWEVFNQSRPGDNTSTIGPRFALAGEPSPGTRYLLTVKPSYVVLGLSLGNEGIRNGVSRQEKDAVSDQFAAGLRRLIARVRENGLMPVVALCYTRNDFTDVEYEYTRRMNLAINSWDLPSVNLLGAVDDGAGKWAKGFWSDALHPNGVGYDELIAAFVPTLFEALERGKPGPARSAARGFARSLDGPALTFAPDSPMHPFALAVSVRTASDGPVVSIGGASQTSTGRAPAGNVSAGLSVVGGRWSYQTTDGRLVASAVRADADWHQLALSHYWARGETLFFVDGRLAGRATERLQPETMSLGGRPASDRLHSIDFKDLLIYRSALNADEVRALHSGTLLQASLEVYAPLADASFARGSAVENRAQSLSAVRVMGSVARGSE